MSASDWVHLDVSEILRETDDAFLLLLGDGEQVWIPLSQIADSGDLGEGDENCTVSVTRWIAEKRGLA